MTPPRRASRHRGRRLRGGPCPAGRAPEPHPTAPRRSPSPARRPRPPARVRRRPGSASCPSLVLPVLGGPPGRESRATKNRGHRRGAAAPGVSVPWRPRFVVSDAPFRAPGPVPPGRAARASSWTHPRRCGGSCSKPYAYRPDDASSDFRDPAVTAVARTHHPVLHITRAQSPSFAAPVSLGTPVSIGTPGTAETPPGAPPAPGDRRLAGDRIDHRPACPGARITPAGGRGRRGDRPVAGLGRWVRRARLIQPPAVRRHRAAGRSPRSNRRPTQDRAGAPGTQTRAHAPSPTCAATSGRCRTGV